MTPTSPAHRELTRQVHVLFSPSGGRSLPTAAPTVGVEIELLVGRADERQGFPVAPADVRAALAADPCIAVLATVSFEPGGQLELSVPPARSVQALVTRAADAVRRTETVLAARGLRLVVGAVDPCADVEPQLREPSERYLVMRRHFDADGPAGATMMCRTAALQVCVGLAGGGATARQWLTANMIGPSLAAAFRTTHGPGNRTAIWLGVDSTRTGMDGRQVDPGRPAEAYTEFALGAHVLPLGLPADHAVHQEPTTMAAWIARGEDRPDRHDIRHHLSTLFPPVRPRGYIEMRYLDAQRPGGLTVATTLLAVLLTDPEAQGTALALTGGDPDRLARDWRRSADIGLSDDTLRRTAVGLGRVAAERACAVSRRWPGWLPADARDRLSAWADSVAASASARRSA
jgi:glutamate--cysteine ligase